MDETESAPQAVSGRTPAGPRLATLRDFLRTEAGGAIVLLAATLTALVWADSPWRDGYVQLWATDITLVASDFRLSHDLGHWVNDGLMTLFFLLVLTMPVDPRSDHLRGTRDATVTLLEYGDYECPHCAGAAPVVLQLLERSAGSLRFVWRHLPLPDVHPNAALAAEAAEAAGAQGDFWGMHDRLFERQDDLGLPDLIDRARRPCGGAVRESSARGSLQ